ncbi:MAG: oxamate carbamoyltransferase subunit AllG family protein, partial [Blastococcus sp.]
MTEPLGGLLSAPPAIVAAGVDVFSDALRAQGADVHDVEWRPPHFGSPADIAALALDPRRAMANRVAVERVLAAGSVLVDVRPAREVLGLPDRTLLHSGPPLTWEAASGPMRGALIGACLFEGWATDVEDAERILAAGEITLDPCHHHRTVGPMAGVTSPSMWMWCLQDPVHGGRAFCNLNEGLGKVLRMGAFNDEVQTRLAWMRDVLGPILSK